MAPNQVIFMAAKCRPRIVIDVILQKRRFLARAECLQCPVENEIPGPIKRHDIPQARAFGGGVFQMPHVNIHAPGIQEKTPIARGFVSPAIVDIHNPDSIYKKNVILHLDRNRVWTHKAIAFGCQTPVLGLQTKNAISHAILNPP